MTCPADCMERHLSNSRWIKAALKLALTACLGVGGLYLYGAKVYASSEDVSDLKLTVKEQRAEILAELKSINQKLDAMRGLSSAAGKPNGP